MLARARARSVPQFCFFAGKEYEMRPTNAYPGLITPQLKDALGMTDGAPPPWLINMQRYGPPPSYPSLKIPGLNAPIPDGSDFGYHPGGWGKPPVDHQGQPLYGDVFGQQIVLDDDLDDAVRPELSGRCWHAGSQGHASDMCLYELA